jgi:hypothetical protein
MLLIILVAMMGPIATRLLVFLILFLAGSVCTNLTLCTKLCPSYTQPPIALSLMD